MIFVIGLKPPFSMEFYRKQNIIRSSAGVLRKKINPQSGGLKNIR
jgi:hypothetical protein